MYILLTSHRPACLPRAAAAVASGALATAERAVGVFYRGGRTNVRPRRRAKCDRKPCALLRSPSVNPTPLRPNPLRALDLQLRGVLFAVRLVL